MAGIASWQAKIEIDIKDLQNQLKSAESNIDKITNEPRTIELGIDTKTLESAISKLDKMLTSLGKGTGGFKQFENLSKQLESITSDVRDFSKAFGKVDDSGAKTLLSSIQNIDKLLSELSQNILNVNKTMSNMGENTSGVAKQAEKVGNAYQNAAKEAEKLADAQNKLGQKAKDAFNNASANTKSESEVMKQVGKAAEEAQKQISKIDFSPNTDRFDDVISKFKILKEEASQISKITKESNQNKDGGYDVSYKATKKDGTSYYLGENSNPNVLKASEVVYNSAVEEKEKLKENKKAWKDLLSAVKQYKKLSTEKAEKTILQSDLDTLNELKNTKIPDIQSRLSSEDLAESKKMLDEIDSEMDKIAKGKMFSVLDDAIKRDEQESKRLVDENIRLNKDYYESKEKDEKNYQTMKKKYLEDGKNQEKAVIEERRKLEESVNADWAAAMADEERESKRLAAENLRINKSYYESKEKDEQEYQRLKKKYSEEGTKQQESIVKERESLEKSVNSDWTAAANEELMSAIKQYKKLSSKIAKETILDPNNSDMVALKKLKEETIPNLQKNPLISPEQLFKSESTLKKIDEEAGQIAEKKLHLDWDAAIKENEKFDKNVSEINEKVAETDKLLDNLSIPKELNNEWIKIIDDVDTLTKKLKSGDLSPSDYSSQRDALLKDYNNKVEIQQHRDVETYNSVASEGSTKNNERQVKVQKALNDALNRYETLQKRIANGNGLSTDEAEAKSLLDTIHELQREDVLSPEKLTESNQRINRINQSVEDIKRNIAETTLDNTQDKIDKYRTTLKNKSAKPVFEDQSVDYKKMLSEFASAISALEDYKTSLAGISELTNEQKKHLQELTDKCQSAAKAFTLLDAAQKGSTEDSRWKEIDKLSKYLTDNTKLSKEAKRELNDYLAQLKSGDPSVNVKKIHTAWTKVAEQERAAGREGKSFFTMLSSAKLGHLVSQIAGFFSFYDLINVVKQAFEVVKQLDYALVDLKKTTSMSSTELERFYYDSNDVAKKMGVTTQEIIDQASAWSRLGYSTKEAATEMAQLSSQFSSISPGMDTDTAQEGLVSIMKAWDIDPDQVKSEIMDNINALGNAMAESNQDIVEGMERSAAALAAVGTDYEDAFAMFSGMQEVLQSAEVAGRALRSISMRIRGYDETTEELSDDLKTVTGDLADLTKTAQHAQGVSIFKDGSTTEFKSLVDYFGEINEIWDEMSQKQQNDFLQKAFGKTQAQAGSALIQNYSAVTKALEVMDEAAGSSDREMETVKESLEYKINALKETWVGTAQDILDRGDLGKIIDALTTVSEAIGSVTSNIGLLKAAALGIGAALSIKNVGRDKTCSLFCHFEYADNTHNLLRIRRFRVCYS